MANMGYCRFENTLRDLQDCYDHLFDDYLSKDEEKARIELINLCHNIVEDDRD